MKSKKIISFIFLSIFLVLILIIYISLAPNKSLVKFIIQKNYKYFVLQQNNNKFLNIYLDFIVQNYFKNNFLAQEKDTKIITKKTKEFFIDQEDSYFYDINPKISKASLGAVLIYGFGACESINGILGLRLSKNIKNIELFSLYNNKDKISPHTILRIRENEKVYFMDIWGLNRNIKYTFEKSNPNEALQLKIYNKNFYKKKFDKNLFDDGFIIKKYDIMSFILSGLKKISNFNLNFNKKNNLTANINTQKVKKNDLVLKNSNQDIYKKNINIEKDLIYLFIEGRFEHINNNFDEAYKLYNKIIESNCNYEFCKITKLLVLKKI